MHINGAYKSVGPVKSKQAYSVPLLGQRTNRVEKEKHGRVFKVVDGRPEVVTVEMCVRGHSSDINPVSGSGQINAQADVGFSQSTTFKRK